MGEDDPVARMRAEMDQMKEALKEFAGQVYAFYAEAKEQGFSEEQAFRLSRDYLVALFSGMQGGGDRE